MNNSQDNLATCRVLNRLLRLLCRSMPAYLETIRPWTSPDDRPLAASLTRLVADEHALSLRVAQAIVQRGGQPEPGAFPSQFAFLNDIGLQYLGTKVIESLKCEAQQIAQMAAELAADAPARALAEEVLGNRQGHLDLLAEGMPAARPAIAATPQ